MATFATRVKELRTKAGLTQAQLADEIGLTKQTISMWERGARKPDFETMDNLADYFHVHLSYLIGAIDDPTPAPAPTSLEGAISGEQDKVMDLVNITSLFCQLSEETQRIVKGAILEAYRIDREQDRLLEKDAYEVSIKSKWLKKYGGDYAE